MPQPVLSDADRARLAARYPPPRIPRVAWIAGIAAVAVTLSALWIWVAAEQSNTDAAGSVHTFEVFDDRIEAVITVNRPDPGRAARCEVFAQAINYERVGEVELDVPPSAATATELAVTVRTYRRATAIDVGKCVLTP